MLHLSGSTTSQPAFRLPASPSRSKLAACCQNDFARLENFMNRRIPVLVVIFAVAVFFTVSGAFSQPESQSKRRAINASDRSPQAPYSTAILVGDTLYMAGNIGHDPQTGKVPQKIEDEIKLLLDGYKSTLAQANMTMDELVYVQIACTDLAYYDKFNATYKTYFSKDLPAREFIGAGSLLSGGHFEMQAIAVRH
jgi:2-iminobutanoate/2-iminopropanoate deaminase